MQLLPYARTIAAFGRTVWRRPRLRRFRSRKWVWSGPEILLADLHLLQVRGLRPIRSGNSFDWTSTTTRRPVKEFEDENKFKDDHALEEFKNKFKDDHTFEEFENEFKIWVWKFGSIFIYKSEVLKVVDWELRPIWSRNSFRLIFIYYKSFQADGVRKLRLIFIYYKSTVLGKLPEKTVGISQLYEPKS